MKFFHTYFKNELDDKIRHLWIDNIIQKQVIHQQLEKTPKMNYKRTCVSPGPVQNEQHIPVQALTDTRTHPQSGPPYKRESGKP